MIVLTEILWRWSFGVIACLFLFFNGLALLGSVPASDSTTNAWRSHDPALMAFTALHIVHILGVKVLVSAIVLPIFVALLWAVLASLGRGVTVKRLRPAVTPLGFRSLLALHCLRALIAWLAFLALCAAIGVVIWIAIHGDKPDLFLFYALAVPSVLVISCLWLAVNWRLTLAGIFGSNGKSILGAMRQAKQVIRAQSADFGGISLIFLLLRLVALLIAFSAIGIPSGMMKTSPDAYAALVAVVLLAYFAIGDFLYVSRMASYVALAAAGAESDGPEPGQVSSSAGVRQPSAL